ncbi:hypothetical protein BM1_01439 [Bipolaris maydis]|nr:hypothetical protein BM1_01439 [Bipolaris maydis]
MKLIITGATGYVATAVLRQALLLPSITSVVAIARRSVSCPKSIPTANASKLKSIVVPAYDTYSRDVRRELEGANACIWTVAITPSKARQMAPETVRMVCQDWVVEGLKAILEANPSPEQPLRFLYMSGSMAFDPARPRSRNKTIWIPSYIMEYSKMRLLDIVAENRTIAEVCIVKPGYISGKDLLNSIFGMLLSLTGLAETIHINEVSAAMLHQIVHGFEDSDGVLLNKELLIIGKEAINLKK